MGLLEGRNYAGMRDNCRMPPAPAPAAGISGAPILIGELLRKGAERLRTASDSPRLDCELLLSHALDLSRASLHARTEAALEPEQVVRVSAMLEERAAGRPVAQIIGRKEFYSLQFQVTPEVLTPRPETELLVELVCGHLRAVTGKADGLDLGTGSGAVAIALARSAPNARLVATDISTAALAVAQRNAVNLAPNRIHFVPGSWYEAIKAGRRFDAIAANPPYVESPLCRRPPLRFEPRAALDGGPDGLKHLRAVISGAPAYLKPGGMLAVEHGAAQGAAVRSLMHDAGLKTPSTHRDLAGHERVTAAWMTAGG